MPEQLGQTHSQNVEFSLNGFSLTNKKTIISLNVIVLIQSIFILISLGLFSLSI
jgi:hypothetical protein